jgi:magnesium-transporting ATPase (P-type)
VLLDGKYVHMDPSGLLVGDIVKLEAGRHVPADVRLLKVNETYELCRAGSAEHIGLD